MARHRVGDLLGEARDLVDLHAGRELELVAGDGGADGRAEQAGVDAELAHRRLEHLAALLDECGSTSLDSLRFRTLAGGQLPRALAVTGREVDLELLALVAPSTRPRRRPRPRLLFFFVLFLVVLLVPLRRTRLFLFFFLVFLFFALLLLRLPLPRTRRLFVFVFFVGSLGGRDRRRSRRAGRRARRAWPGVGARSARRRIGVVGALGGSVMHRARPGARRSGRRSRRRDDLAQPGADDEQHPSTPTATSTIDRARVGRARRAAAHRRARRSTPARVLQRFERPVRVLARPRCMKRRRPRRTTSTSPMPRRQAAPGASSSSSSSLGAALARSATRRADEERRSGREPAAAEHAGRAASMPRPERPGEVGVDRREARDARRPRGTIASASGRWRPELLVDVVAPGGRTAGLRRGPSPGFRLTAGARALDRRRVAMPPTLTPAPLATRVSMRPGPHVCGRDARPAGRGYRAPRRSRRRPGTPGR